MTDIQLYTKFSVLNPSLKLEVNDFVDFLISKQKKELHHKQPVFGCAKGRFKISDDFNEPIEDMKDYMF